jgi:hypothetical protein
MNWVMYVRCIAANVRTYLFSPSRFKTAKARHCFISLGARLTKSKLSANTVHDARRSLFWDACGRIKVRCKTAVLAFVAY